MAPQRRGSSPSSASCSPTCGGLSYDGLFLAKVRSGSECGGAGVFAGLNRVVDQQQVSASARDRAARADGVVRAASCGVEPVNGIRVIGNDAFRKNFVGCGGGNAWYRIMRYVAQ